MTLANNDPSFPILSPSVDQAGPVVAGAVKFDTRAFWKQAHDVIQEQLAALDNDVRRSAGDVRVTAGSTHGERFPLFSYRTFAVPLSEIDPVVVGVTFNYANKAIVLQADVSGEQIGDMIESLADQVAPGQPDELLSVARETARRLLPAAKAIAAALQDSARKVQ